MRKLIATVFNYSLDGLIAGEGTEFWKFCFSLPATRKPDDPAQFEFLRRLCAHHGPQHLREHRQGHDNTVRSAGLAGRLRAQHLREHRQGHDNGDRPPLLPYPDRRPQGRILPHTEEGRLGQYDH